MKSTIIFSSVLSLVLLSCGKEAATDQRESGRSVFITIPEGGANSATSNFSSNVEEGKSINVSFKTGGEIKRLPLKEGDRVTKGMTLGSLDDADYRLSLKQVQTQYDQTAAEVNRYEEMYKRNNLAANDYEKAKAGLEQLRVQLDLVKNKLAYTRLVSPSSGYIVEKYMEEGEMTGAGTPVYKIMDTSSLETSVAVPASVYTRRSEITSCHGKSAATGENTIPLEIISFVPDADNNGLYRLRLRIPGEYRNRLTPGMNMTVSLNFNSAGSETSFIPSRAIFEKNGKEYVWVVSGKDSTLCAKEIKAIGAPSGKRSEVSGLDGNEKIVAAGVHHLNNGEKVKIEGEISNLKK